MIVYYDPVSFSITCLSYKANPTQTNPFILTDEQIAEDLFLGKDKTLNYTVLVRDAEQHNGFIKKKGHISKGHLIDEKFYLVPFENRSAEVKIIQDASKKTITVNLIDSAKEWWQTEKDKHEVIAFYACEPYDLFRPLWITTLSTDQLLDSVEFEYQGKDAFCLFTKKIFESYSHERS